MKRANRPLSNRSKSRPIQKPSKKLGCKSYLRVLKCHNEKGNLVRVIHYTRHNGHIPGTDEDLRHFCISQQAKKWIHARAKDGMQPSQIVSIFHRRINQFHENKDSDSLTLIQRRDMYLSYIDIYNIVNDEMKGVIFLGNKKEEYDNEGRQNVPVTHLISEKKAGDTLIFWLEAIKNQNQEWKPHTFLTDCDDAQQNAIRTVYLGATILLCQWHIKNAWQKNKGKIKADGNYFAAQEKNKNNSNIIKRSGKQATQKTALDELGIIMRIRDISQREYRGNCEMWIDAYRLYEHQEMNTTNFIEAWHKKLKYTYLEAKYNHRIDTLIWILRAAIMDAQFECEAIHLMIGRMKPRQKEQ
ncbi:3710_t:CDS:2 [Ambispora gerdemannii]|uniref:3710_t:CDS:1 n=1 Tax=Ambispora gerdemannii TaxID=144530 RepID=A0A9N9DFR2_9GLOM|nr:3710_t:CDS:2 [Ambispora gerdemannii]